MDFEIGDVIEYDVGDGRHLLAHVDAIFDDSYMFGTFQDVELVISFLDPGLYPQTSRVPAKRCKLWNRLGSHVKCECGADKVYGKGKESIFHSTWCPVVPKGSYGKHN